jgi:hypothetical protein
MMGKFIEFISESLQKGEYKNGGPAYSYNDHQHLRPTVKPALKHKASGTIHIGKRGETHEDLIAKHKKDTEYTSSYDSGYYHGPTKTYHSRKNLQFDSTDLMSPHQLTRFYAHGDK